MQAIKPKRSLVEETHDILVDAICSGQISSGERLNQDDIAARLNVSRQPVNSAISILKANGLVEDTGRRGVVVAAFDPVLFRSIFEYRKVIEPFVARSAAKAVTPKDRAAADRVLRAGQKAIRSGTLIELVQADMQFHAYIYELSQNKVVQSSMKMNWIHIRRSMAEVLSDPTSVIPVWEEHHDIIDKLFSGQSEEAARIMEHHIDHAYRAIFAAIPRT